MRHGRLLFVLGLTVAWMGGVVWRLYDVQIRDHESFLRRAVRQQQQVLELDPPRGTIYDARGRELAVSVAVESAFAVPREVRDPEAAARAIARIARVDAARLRQSLASDREFVWVARKLDPPQARALRDAALPGLYFLEESKRYYPMREVAAAVLGYVGTDHHGLAGLEAEWERAVAGTPGRRTVLRDARQATLASLDLEISEPQPGEDLVLTLDAALQHIAEQELARAVEARRAKSGSLVLLDPGSGAVLAMASHPGFDPNHFAAYPQESWRNRAVMDAYEPGSTFKMVTAAAALDAGLVDPDDLFDCEMGAITLARTRISDHKPFGLLTFREVIAKSSNVGTIKTALRVANRPFHDTVRAFGFGRGTGIDLPGESAGLLLPVERWGATTKAYVSFGQGISVTPIQIAAAFAAVANGGRLLRPYVVAEVGRAGERRRLHPEPAVVREPVARETIATLRELLAEAVANGTGKQAAIEGYAVAGKTGTAQKAVPGVGYLHDEFVASFVGFAPAERPVVVAAVAIDDPKGAYHGGEVAAPVFRAVVERALLYLGVPPRREPLERWPGEPAAPAEEPADAEPVLVAEVAAEADPEPAPAGPALPDLVGRSAREAMAGVARLGLRPILVGQGVVERQEPPAGTPLPPRGSPVQLYLGTGVS
ncbi:MAG TPA: penicillin-binding transpeptidase domain-containing protein [Thermoanaerobaculia bacterium]|nr:penicillin-binding transpeptidase domain-containing protein [Thermoanaerobaculia bacterium]